MNTRDSVVKDYTLLDYWLIAYERRYAIVLVAAASVSVALALSMALPSVFEARSVFYVPSPMSQPLLERGAVPPFPSGLQDEARAYVKILRGNNIQDRIRESLPDVDPGIFGRVDFSASREGMITIYVRDKNPEAAARVANEYIRAFNSFSDENARAQIVSSLTAVEMQIQEFEKKLDEFTAARRDFRQQHSVAAPENEMDELVRQRQVFERELKSAQITLDSVNEQLQGGPGRSVGEANPVSVEGDAEPAILESLRRSMAQLEIELAGKRAQLTANHPQVIALESQHSQAKQELTRELNRVRRETEARVKGLESMVAALNGRIRQRPAVIAEADRLDREAERYSELLNNALKQREDLKIQGVKGYGGAVVVETALPPGSPAFPNVIVNVIMALILGLGGGVLYAFFLDYVERVREASRLRDFELERMIELPKIDIGEHPEQAKERALFERSTGVGH